MQNYIVKKTHKFIFHIFFFEKQIKNHVSLFSTFISTKHSNVIIWKWNWASQLGLMCFFICFVWKCRSFETS